MLQNAFQLMRSSSSSERLFVVLQLMRLARMSASVMIFFVMIVYFYVYEIRVAVIVRCSRLVAVTNFLSHCSPNDTQIDFR